MSVQLDTICPSCLVEMELSFEETTGMVWRCKRCKTEKRPYKLADGSPLIKTSSDEFDPKMEFWEGWV